MILVLLSALIVVLSARAHTHWKLIEPISADVADWNSVKDSYNGKEELQLGWSSLTEDEMQQVLSLEYPKLKHLMLHKGDPNFMSTKNVPYHMSQTLTKKTLPLIFKGKYFSHLRSLNLQSTNIDDRYFEFLDDEDGLETQIESLNLGFNYISREGFARLARIKWKGLRQLRIKNNLLIEEKAVQNLITIICGGGKTCSSQLEVLDIGWTDISRDGFIKLIKAVNGTALRGKLEALSVINYKTLKEGFNHTAFEALAGVSMPNLQNLSLVDSAFIDESALALKDWKTPRLQRLNLDGTTVGDRGLMAWVNKANMPNLKELIIKFTLVSSEGIEHLMNESFTFEKLDFVDSMTDFAGMMTFMGMGLDKLTELSLGKLSVEKQKIQRLFQNVSLPSVRSLTIRQLSPSSIIPMMGVVADLPNLEEIYFEDDPFLVYSLLSSPDLDLSQLSQQQVKALVSSYKLESIKRVVFKRVGMDMQFAFLTVMIVSELFPNLQHLKFIQDDTFPLVTIEFQTGTFKEGLVVESPTITMKYMARQFQVIKVLVPMILCFTGSDFDTSKANIKQVSKVFVIEDIVELGLADLRDISAFVSLAKQQRVTTFRQLTRFQLKAETPLEYFMDNIGQYDFPSLTALAANLLVTAEENSGQVYQTIYDYLSRFSKLTTFQVELTFLSEDGQKIKQQIFDSLSYPHLVGMQVSKQNAELEVYQKFIRNHRYSLRALGVSGNFMEKGLFDLMIDSGVVLAELDISSISFVEEEFEKLGRMRTEFFHELLFEETGLTDAHVVRMVQQNGDQPLFPKVEQVNMVQNEVKGEAVRKMLESGMHRLVYLLLERNNNPAFVSQILNHPTRIRTLVAVDVDIYEIDPELHPLSSRLIDTLVLKLDSLTVEDYVSLGRLEFPRLRTVEVILSNIYDCEALRSLLNIVKHARQFVMIISNDRQGLNSSCLAGQHTYHNSMEMMQLADSYGTTSLPHFYQAVTNSTHQIEATEAFYMRLPPSSFEVFASQDRQSVEEFAAVSSYIDDKAFEKLMSSFNPRTLHALNLADNQITTDALVRVFGKEDYNLRQLVLSGNLIKPDFFENLGELARNVRQLSLARCGIDFQGLAALSSTDFAQLSILDLSYNELTEDDIMAFASDYQSKRTPSLQKVSFKGVAISKQKHDRVTKIMNTKNLNVELDLPYYLPHKNSVVM